MNKFLKILLSLFLLLIVSSCKDTKLPLPELSEGIRGELGIDKNINESTIDKYLNREDSVYFDMRMLVDDAEYENIGGDSYLSGIVKGFEVLPYPYICNVEGLPQEVGQGYKGNTLFSHIDDEYVANYKESYEIIEQYFPKDKYIFLMCGGGGYAGMMKNLLVYLGYDENKIYNVGGYWYYEGNNKIETVYYDDENPKYDFSLITYHDVDFNKLTKIRDSIIVNDNVNLSEVFTNIDTVVDLYKLINSKETVAVFVYLPNCSSCAKFLPIVKEFVDNNEIDMYSVSLRDIWYEDNPIKDKVSYTPSMFIFSKGKVLAYLDPGKDSDKQYYETTQGLSNWFNMYIDVNIIKSDLNLNLEDCDLACKIGD